MAPQRNDAVHRYFQYDETTNITTCQLCKNKLKGKHTTNLKSHLATKHLMEYQVVTDLNRKVVRPVKSNTEVTEDKECKIAELKKHCVKLVTVHGRPLAMLDDAAFKDIIDMAALSDTGHKHVNVKAIKTLIHEEAMEIKNKIFADVKNKMICLKLDAATCQERKFIGVNIQYIHDDKIVVRNLSVLEITSRQTSDFLKTTIEQILTEFRILKEQLYCVCTDNGKNMVKMVKLMGGSYISEDYQDGEISDDEEENFDEEDIADEFSTDEINVENFIETDGIFKVRGMLCVAHTLQLAVKDAFNQDVEAQATRALAGTVVNILKKPNNLNQIRRENIRKPIKDCPTRWTSTFNMLVRLINLRGFCEKVPEVVLVISEQFWNDIANLVKCLEPATNATIKLQSEQLTMGDFYITWLNCKSQIASIEHPFATILKNSMTERESKLLENDVVLEALYMDSRLNILLTPEQCQKARALLREVYRQSNSIKNLDTEQHSDAELIDMMITIENPRPSTSTDLTQVEAILQTRERERLRRNIIQKRSFDVCLHELYTCPRLGLKENIIMHWHNKSISTSELAAVANIVLGAPATQVSVERLFSSLKFILHPLRTNLSAMFLNNIMLVRANKDLL